MKSIEAILLVEDNQGDTRLIREMFNESDTLHVDLADVNCMKGAEKYISENVVDLILLDLGLPDAQGLEALRRTRVAAPRVPIVVLTGLDDESLAAQALQEGAQDFLIKGQIDSRGLLRALRYASERKRLEWMKDEFVSSVSHELRTPLTSISGSLGLLMANSAGNLPATAVRLLKIAHTNSQRLVRLVNDILDIEKMDSGRAVFIFKRIDVRSLVEEEIEANRGFADSSGIRIRLEDTDIVGDVRADSDRLAQVITNLLSNAIKFSPVGGEVSVAIQKIADVVRISVRDHGHGISADFKTRVFERFVQANAAKGKENGGTGLGLSIVKQIVDRLGGEVNFTDAPGGGTIFYVDLPGWDCVEKMKIDLDARPDAVRLLLCEDDLDTAVSIREQLRSAGFKTDFAFTAGDAIDSAKATQYRAVLIDLLLPDRDGLSVILRLRQLQQYKNTPMIVVSADPGQGRADARSHRLNVVEWLKKPVDFERLVRALPKPAIHHHAN